MQSIEKHIQHVDDQVDDVSRLLEILSEGLKDTTAMSSQNKLDIESLQLQVGDANDKIREVNDRLQSDIMDLCKQVADLFDKTGDLDTRVTVLENVPPPQFESYASEIEELFAKIKDHDHQLTNKVDCDTFDNENASLREMIGNMEPDDAKPIIVRTNNLPKPVHNVSQFSTKDVNRIKEMLDKFPSIEELLNKLLK